MNHDFENSTSDVVLNHLDIPVYEPIIVEPLPENICRINNNEPRLMISQIVNENFKSYAGTKILGPFHKNFNAIVGPNGSGKSNVIDSMLFVFGFRAAKIRSKNISVLIHSSEDKQNIQSCTVSVHFQKIYDEGPDSYSIINGSKFVVSRTAFKDNSSYYRLNDKKVMYNEIGAFLRSNGIDLDHNRFLILQGEVEQIAMMKPKAASENEDGMLEFLEDIIGSNRFKLPLETLKKREDELSEMRVEQLNRVKAIEKEKDNLEGPKNEAIKYLEIENDFMKTNNKIYQRMIYDSDLKEKESRKIRDQIENERKDFENRIREIHNEKKIKLAAHKKTIKQYDELTREDEAMHEKFKKFEELDVKCRENIKHTQELIRKNNKALETENKRLEDFKQVPDGHHKQIESCKKQLDKLQKSKDKEYECLKTVMDSFKSETAELQNEKLIKEKEVLGMQKAVNTAHSKYNESLLNLDLFKSNLTKEKAIHEDLENNIKRIETNLSEKKKTYEDLEKKIPETTISYEKASKDLNQINQNEQIKIEQTRKVRAKLEDARSHMQASTSQSRVVDFVMNLKRNNEIKGIYGRLGNLGAIDEKYDVAISTASSALDYIVVETMDVAQSCVELLKQNNVGLATFIGLDKQQGLQQYCNQKIKTPENAPRLFDLIKVKDEAVLPAFYFALRNTLVANDLDQATRIAYGAQRFRVVTLEGQLIDISGTMSGGGNRVTRGKMGSSLQADSIDPAVILKWEQELEQNMKESNALRDNRGKLEEMVEKLMRNKQDMAHQFKMVGRDIKFMEEQLVQLNKQVKEQIIKIKNAAPDESKLKDLEKTNNSLKKDYDDINNTFTKLQEEIQDINKQIMEIGGDEMKAIQTRITLFDTQINQVSGNLSKATVCIKTAERNYKKSSEKVESLTNDLAKQTHDLEILKKEIDDLETSATTLLNENQSLKTQIEQVGAEVKEVTTIIDDLEKEEVKIKKESIEIGHRLEKAVQDQKLQEEIIINLTNKLNKIVLNHIESKEQENLAKYSEEEILQIDVQSEKNAASEIQATLKNLKPNMAAIEEFRIKEDMYLQRVDRLMAITNLRNEQRNQFEELRKQRIEEFMYGFNAITNKLKEMYQMITLGGDAEFEIVDSMDPFSEGVVFSVRPPKKSWKNISNLSGGEKTLSSLALVFALHHYKPTPLYVMDEIDAALDFRNVSIVANYIKDRTKDAQFIIISLRSNMFELCDHLIGIYKTRNCTDSVGINPRLNEPDSVVQNLPIKS